MVSSAIASARSHPFGAPPFHFGDQMLLWSHFVEPRGSHPNLFLKTKKPRYREALLFW